MPSRHQICLRATRFLPISLTVHSPASGFAPLPYSAPQVSRGDDEPPVQFKPGPLKPFGKPPTEISLGGLTSSTPRARPNDGPAGVSITGTADLAGGPFNVSEGVTTAASSLRTDELRGSSETSVAYGPNDVVMYTANGGAAGDPNNFGAGYSTDGGADFRRLYVTTTRPGTTALFPYPTYSAKGPTKATCYPFCDQIVIYDRYNRMFIWAIQYPQDKANANSNVVRLAWAGASTLASHGALAWNYVDLSSSSFSSSSFLDQPRFGLTPGYLYVSFNLPAGAIIRIGNNAFKDKRFQKPKGVLPAPPIPAGAAQLITDQSGVCPTCRLHVAQSVPGDQEYFVGFGTTVGNMDVASITDTQSSLISEIVPTWWRAVSPSTGPVASDWTSRVPDGSDWLARVSGTPINLGVTVGGDGGIWAAWTEGRTVYDAKNRATDVFGSLLSGFATTYAEPHLGVAEFQERTVAVSAGSPLSVLAGTKSITYFRVNLQDELMNRGYALSMPDLATDADGEVAMGFYAGGGPSAATASGSIYAVHGVGFLTNSAQFVTDARSTAFSADGLNIYGDYNAVRPLPPPYGNCLVSSSVVSQSEPGALIQNHPVFTLFSRAGQTCPRLHITKPPPPVLKTSTTLTLRTLDGTTSYLPGATTHLEADLTPHDQVGDSASFVITSPTGAQSTVSNGFDALGRSRAQLTLDRLGTWTIQAHFQGTTALAGSDSNTLTLTVSAPPKPSSLAMNCPQTASLGEDLTLTAQLNPSLQGASVDWSGSVPDGSTVSQTVQTDTTGTSYYNVTVGTAGVWTFGARWAGAAGYSGSTGTCTISVQAPSTVTVTCPPTATIFDGDPATINGSLTPAVNASPVSVSFTPEHPSLGGTATTHDTTTDASGTFSERYTFNAPDFWSVKVTFAGDSTREPTSASCTFQVLAH